MPINEDTGLLPPPSQAETTALQIMLQADPSSKYGKRTPCAPGERANTNDVLRVMDEYRNQHGRSPLSALVVANRTGKVSSVFWESVDRFELRRPGEDDATLLMRIRASLVQEEGAERAAPPSSLV